MRNRPPIPLVVVASLVAVAGVAGAAGVALYLDTGPGEQGPAGADLQFREVGADWGIDYEATGEATGSATGGVAVADVDRDGRPDVLAVGGPEPVLYENTGESYVESGALPNASYPTIKSAHFFDATGDGWEDLLLIPKAGEPIFLRNDGGTFTTEEAGFDHELRWGTGAAAGDFTGNGLLDVVIIQNGNWTAETPRRGVDGEATDGYPNLLYRNTGDGFERVESEAVAGPRWSLAVSAADFTGDGLADIHVANDYGFDVILENQGNMSFEREPIGKTNLHGMSSIVRDVNGDGHLDVFVTNIRFDDTEDVWALNSGLGVRNRGNTLLLNDGNGSFTDVTDEYGLRKGGGGWAAAIEDFDNGGDLEVLHATTSYLERTEDGGFRSVETPPALWTRVGEGNFTRVNASDAGFLPSNGRGLATLDFDGDGNLDVLVADTSGRFKLYENRNDEGNRLRVRLRGGERTVLGTTVVVETDGDTYEQVLTSRSDFFSQSSRVLHFGLGSEEPQRVRIVRPDGTEHVYEDVAPNQRLVVAPDGSVTVADG